MQKTKSTLGFSLIELMIVVAIIGILVVIVMPSYQIYTRRARYVEIIHAATPYKISLQECFQVTDSLKDCRPGENGIPAEQHTPTGLVHTITINNRNVITVTPTKRYGITPKDTYTLTPVVTHDHLQWISGGGGVAKGYAH